MGMPYAASLEHLPADQAANVRASMAAIRAAQQSGKDWSKPAVGDVTHNHNLTVGDVTVNTRATDPAGTGAAVHGALKQLVTSANSAVAG